MELDVQTQTTTAEAQQETTQEASTQPLAATSAALVSETTSAIMLFTTPSPRPPCGVCSNLCARLTVRECFSPCVISAQCHQMEGQDIIRFLLVELNCAWSLGRKARESKHPRLLGSGVCVVLDLFNVCVCVCALYIRLYISHEHAHFSCTFH